MHCRDADGLGRMTGKIARFPRIGLKVVIPRVGPRIQGRKERGAGIES